MARVLRAAVHELLVHHLPAGGRILDAGCGTGTDAAWLLEQGHEVLAIDAAPGMVAAARARRPDLDARVLAVEAAGALGPGRFGGALLDFGVVNLLDLDRALAALARVLRPGAPLVVVSMPRLAPALVLGLLRRGRPGRALERLRGEVEVDVEGAAVRTRYLGRRALRRAGAPWFEEVDALGLGFLLPAPGSAGLGRRPGLLDGLARLETPLRRLPGLRELGDHVAVVLRRRAPQAPRALGPLGRRRRTAEARRTGRITRLPVLVLELTRGCQSRCVGCGYRGPAGGEALELEVIRGLVAEARELGTREVLLTGGEPLLRPDLPEILEAVRGAGLDATLLTNGLALARHAELVARWCTAVVVSLDGHDGPSYKASRGVDGLGALGRGVAAVRSLAPSLPLTARVTVTGLNQGTLEAIARTARELGLDGVSYLAADLDSEVAFGERAGTPPPQPDAQALRRELEGLRAALPEGFLLDSDAALARIWKLAAWREGGPAPGPPRCDAPWTSAVVGADLSLQPCFFLPAEASVRDGLGVGLRASTERLARLRLDEEPACARCVCWARLG